MGNGAGSWVWHLQGHMHGLSLWMLPTAFLSAALAFYNLFLRFLCTLPVSTLPSYLLFYITLPLMPSASAVRLDFVPYAGLSLYGTPSCHIWRMCVKRGWAIANCCFSPLVTTAFALAATCVS
jgi:hypothetical protein